MPLSGDGAAPMAVDGQSDGRAPPRKLYVGTAALGHRRDDMQVSERIGIHTDSCHCTGCGAEAANAGPVHMSMLYMCQRDLPLVRATACTLITGRQKDICFFAPPDYRLQPRGHRI